MGNYIPCTLATRRDRTAKASRVIFPGGEIKQFRQPLKAAELMFECPNFFLANSASIHIGRRFSALHADEDLELGNVYIMCPMKRLSSVVTAADMAAFFIAANSAAKRISGGNNNFRVLPDSSGDNNVQESHRKSEDGGPRLSLEGVEELSAPEFQYRLSMSRSRKPSLETINE